MKKTILISLTIALIMACNTKKGADGSALLFGLLGGGESTAATPAAVADSSGNSFTVVSLDSTTANTTPVATTAEPAASTATTNSPGSSATNSNTTTVATTTTVTPVTPGSNFAFESNITVPITITVTSPGGPIVGAPVTVSEDTTNPGTENFLGSGTTNGQGTTTMPISVPPNVTEVNVGVVGTNPATGETLVLSGSAPVQTPNSGSNNNSGSSGSSGNTTSGTTTVAPILSIYTDNFQAPQGCLTDIDQDCDGLPDIFDSFPTNPSLGVRTLSGRYTISYESLFPNAGDADLNDFTMVYSTEMDRDPTGKVKILRGIFTVVGRGAGSRHELRLSLKVPSDATITEHTYLNDNGTPWLLTDGTNRSACVTAPKYAQLGFTGLPRGNTADCLANGRITRTQMERGLLIMPDSQLTSFNVWNTRPEEIQRVGYRKGVTSKFEIVFDTPVDLNTSENTVAGHLNWWIAFVRGGQTTPVWVVKRPGYETESFLCPGTNVARIKDKFVDCKGFPFAIIVPGVFNFPIEGGDIRNPATTGYANFRVWAESLGTQERLWFNTVTDPTKVVNLRSFYTQTSFSAFMVQAVKQNLWEISFGLILVGAAMGYVLKRHWKVPA